MNLERVTKNNGETMVLLEDIAQVVPNLFYNFINYYKQRKRDKTKETMCQNKGGGKGDEIS
jgi:hypothetical protein